MGIIPLFRSQNDAQPGVVGRRLAQALATADAMFTELYAAIAVVRPIILDQSGVAVSHTGDTVETTLKTIPCPALGGNAQLVIETLWSVTNNANSKTPRIRLGGTNVHGPALTTVASFHDRARIANRNNPASQIINANSATVFGATTGAVFTTAVNTAAPFDITLTAQLASAADTMTLESYLITLFPKN